MCLIACTPFTKIIYIHTDFPLPLRNSFSELSEMLSPGLQSSFCYKYNLIHNSHMEHILESTPSWTENRRHHYHQRLGIQGPGAVLANLVRLTLVFLVTSAPLTTSSPNSFFLSILYKVITYLSKSDTSFLFQLFLPVFILLERLPRACKCSTNVQACFFVKLVFRPCQEV